MGRCHRDTALFFYIRVAERSARAGMKNLKTEFSMVKCALNIIK